MRKKITIFAILVVIVTILVVRYFDFRDTPILDDEYLVPITQLDELYNIETGTVYFGADYCPTCVQFKPIVEEFCNSNNFKVYYFDLGYFLDNELLDDNSVNTLLEKYQLEEIPTLVNIKNFEVYDSLTFGYIDDGKHKSILNQIDKFIYIDNTDSKNILSQNDIEFISILLLIASILVACFIYLFISKSKYLKFTNLCFCLNFVIVIGVFILIHKLADGADVYNWSINSVYTVILIATLLISTISNIAIIFIKKRDKSI